MKSKVDYMKESKRKNITIASKTLKDATAVLVHAIPFSHDLTLREEKTLCGLIPKEWMTISQIRPRTLLSSQTLSIALNRLKHRGLVVDRPPKNTNFKKEWKLKDDSDDQDVEEQTDCDRELSREDNYHEESQTDD